MTFPWFQNENSAKSFNLQCKYEEDKRCFRGRRRTQARRCLFLESLDDKKENVVCFWNQEEIKSLKDTHASRNFYIYY